MLEKLFIRIDESI
jgi:hypothetical protein